MTEGEKRKNNGRRGWKKQIEEERGKRGREGGGSKVNGRKKKMEEK